MVSQSALLGEPLTTHVAGVGPLSSVDAHVANQGVVHCELALTDLTAVRLLVGVGPVVERQLRGISM